MSNNRGYGGGYGQAGYSAPSASNAGGYGQPAAAGGNYGPPRGGYGGYSQPAAAAAAGAGAGAAAGGYSGPPGWGPPPASFTPSVNANNNYNAGYGVAPTPGYGQSNYNPNAKIENVNMKVEQVKGQLRENLEMAIARGDQLTEMEDKSTALNEEASKFQDQAAQTRKMFCRRHWRNIVIITLIVGLFVGLIVWWASK